MASVWLHCELKFLIFKTVIRPNTSISDIQKDFGEMSSKRFFSHLHRCSFYNENLLGISLGPSASCGVGTTRLNQKGDLKPPVPPGGFGRKYRNILHWPLDRHQPLCQYWNCQTGLWAPSNKEYGGRNVTWCLGIKSIFKFDFSAVFSELFLFSSIYDVHGTKK